MCVYQWQKILLFTWNIVLSFEKKYDLIDKLRYFEWNWCLIIYPNMKENDINQIILIIWNLKVM